MYELTGLAASHVLTIRGRTIFRGEHSTGVNNMQSEARTSVVLTVYVVHIQGRAAVNTIVHIVHALHPYELSGPFDALPTRH